MQRLYGQVGVWVFALLLVPAAARSHAGEKDDAARCAAVRGTLFARAAGAADWTPVTADTALRGTTTLVALFEADLRSPNDAVELTLIGDVGQRGRFPVLETGVTLQPTSTADLDAALERGVLILTNRKKTGAAKVHLRLRHDEIDVTLKKPGTRLVVEIFARHAPGFAKLNWSKEREPVANLVFLILEGEAYFGTKDKGMLLRAPPGPAMLEWDTVLRTPIVHRLDALPDAAKLDETTKEHFRKLCGYVEHLGGKGLDADLEKLVRSANAEERKVGVICLGALDRLSRLLMAVGDAKHRDVREQAILVLRHWAGREPGQLAKLHKALTTKEFSDAQAKTLVQLLLGFDDEERRMPDTYEFLIGLLGHSRLGVRELAHWHLVRLWPPGRDLPYDAADTEEGRAAGIVAWRTAIPAGELPPVPKKNR